MLGAFGVGKTSLVRRFVHQQFDERYQSTLGVKIDTKIVNVDENTVKLVLWDIEGADPDDTGDSLARRRGNYVKGAHGLLIVADGTRPATVDTALGLYDEFCESSAAIPALLLLNKADLKDEWKMDSGATPGPVESFDTSALDGQNVEHAFNVLAAQLLSNV
jgi:small GTP-binding protein